MQNYKTINEAWYQVCRKCMDEGYTYLIDRGSFEGTERRQLESLAFEITNPEIRPLTVEYKGQVLVTEDQAYQYFQDYLSSDFVQPGEQYTYGSRIAPHIPKIAKMLRETPFTNQATIEVGRPEDVELEHPPCLRSLSWKVVNNKINLTCYFRSWDLAGGLPTNLLGLQLLNETMAAYTEIETGKLICFTDGGHIYSYQHSWFSYD